MAVEWQCGRGFQWERAPRAGLCLVAHRQHGLEVSGSSQKDKCEYRDVVVPIEVTHPKSQEFEAHDLRTQM